MKLNIPTPVIIGVIAVLVLGVGALYFKGAAGETVAPKPDPARFLPHGAKSPAPPSP